MACAVQQQIFAVPRKVWGTAQRAAQQACAQSSTKLNFCTVLCDETAPPIEMRANQPGRKGKWEEKLIVAVLEYPELYKHSNNQLGIPCVCK